VVDADERRIHKVKVRGRNRPGGPPAAPPQGGH
jgi:hypothetical protein